MRAVLAVDPGKTTGLSLFTIEQGEDPVMQWSDEVDFTNYVRRIKEAFAEYGDSLEIICEKFTINVQTAKNSQAPYSLECIGALKLLMLENGREPESLKYQLPANAMNMFPNDKLKKLGYWHRGGAGHALDSMRHGVLYLVTTGWIPRKLLEE